MHTENERAFSMNRCCRISQEKYRYRSQPLQLLPYNNKIQFDLGGKFNILGGDGVGHCKTKVHVNMCFVRTVYRDEAV